MTIQLNPNQQDILAHAVHQTSGKIDWFPEHIRGGARQKVLAGLRNRALVTLDGIDHYVAAEGYDALGLPSPLVAQLPEADLLVADPEQEATVANVEGQWAQGSPTVVVEAVVTSAPNAIVETSAEPAGVHKTRSHSKQATIINMLKRDEGATIDQICESTGWQRHTVRGCFAGAIRKKLGLAITSDKTDSQQRVYRIAA